MERIENGTITIYKKEIKFSNAFFDFLKSFNTLQFKYISKIQANLRGMIIRKDLKASNVITTQSKQRTLLLVY
jgi:hypothetical protein